MTDRRITRADLEAKLREIEAVVDQTRDQARNSGVVIAVTIVTIIAVAYVLGRRRGRSARSARVEIIRL